MMPEFWDELDKDVFCMLRLACKSFKAMIPERDVIMRIFKGKMVKKVDLFRILPLSVNDVIRIRSPVDFTEAFRISERKAGGFSNCMAIVRERGLHTWFIIGEQRAKFRREVEALLLKNGVRNPPKNHPLYNSAIRRGLGNVKIWKYVSTYQRLMPPSKYNPLEVNHSFETSQALFAVFEYDSIMDILRQAMGYWYRGINRDVRSVLAALRDARNKGSFNPKDLHVAISNGVLLIGEITLLSWVMEDVSPMEGISNE